MKYNKARSLAEIKELANEDIEEILIKLGFESVTPWSADNVRACCKLHGGDNPSSFSFDKSIGHWRCFSHQCHLEHNTDVFGIIMATKGCVFIQALRWLTNHLGISGKISSKKCATESSKDFVKRNRPAETPKPIMTYEDFAKTYSSLSSVYFTQQGFSQECQSNFMCFDCLSKNKPMFNRACIPVFDYNKESLIGVSGRTLLEKCGRCESYHYGDVCPDDNPNVFSVPKWKHFNFKAKSELFNINKDFKYRTAILVEGPKDVMRLWDLGVYNSCALMGMHWSKEKTNLLIKRGVDTVVFMLDNDQSVAQERSKEYSNSLKKYFKVHYDRNLLPDGKDPGDLNKTDIDLINKKIGNLINV